MFDQRRGPGLRPARQQRLHDDLGWRRQRYLRFLQLHDQPARSSLRAGGWSPITSTLQLANLSTDHPGHFARGNVFNALQYHGDLRSLIENAIGGSGSRQHQRQPGQQSPHRQWRQRQVDRPRRGVLAGGRPRQLHALRRLSPDGSRRLGGYASLPAGAANNYFGSAFYITPNFALNSDPEIASSTILAHSTVNAIGNGTSGGYY